MNRLLIRPFHYDVPIEKLRNFCIIAHVDHGKSTLADRLMELTGAKPPATHATHHPSLDTLPVERARGITVKTQCVTMPHKSHLLTLMDTPGHVDFGGEVERAVAGCQGAVVVVDATQGVQPQTVNNVERARRMGLAAFVPVLNKIDLRTADVERVCGELAGILGVPGGAVVRVSAKSGLNVPAVLERIISDIPHPPPLVGDTQNTNGIILDSWYDEYRGVICLVKVRSGRIRSDSTLYLASTKEPVSVTQVGYLAPKMYPTGHLSTGHIGYVVTGVKTIRAVRIGDYLVSDPIKETKDAKHTHQITIPKPTIFAGFFPKHSQDYQQLSKALDKLLLNDAAVGVEKAHSAVLGAGFRLGFLGTLHMDVFRERLQGEFAAETIITAPTVTFKVVHKSGAITLVNQPQHFPDHQAMSSVRNILEPVCRVLVSCPEAAIGGVMSLIGDHRGTMIQSDYTARQGMLRVECRVPLLELIGNFHDRLQSATSGSCTFDYEPDGHQPADIVLVKLLVNGDPVDMLSFLSHHSTARPRALDLLLRLKSTLHRHQFQVTLQAAINNRVIAREGVAAMRKDVTAKCYGGDGSRKRKLLEQQKEGKAKLRQIGRVSIDSEAMCDLMRFR